MSSWAIGTAVGLLTVAQAVPAGDVMPLPDALPIEIEIAEPLGSNISHIDDMFAIRIAAPVMVDGKVAISAGTPGRGQVVHAAKSTGLGKAGELILAARFVECGTTRIALRGMRFATSGTDKSTQTMLLSSLAMPFAFLSGGKVVIPAGTRAVAKLSGAVDLPAAGCPSHAALAVTTSQEGKIR